MRNMLKKSLFFAMAVMIMLGVCACTHGQNVDPDPTVTPSPDITVPVTDKPVTPLITGQNFKLVGIYIYTVDATLESVVNKTVMVKDTTEITPELIIEYILDSLKDESVNVSVKDVEYKNGICIVNFDESIIAIAKSNADIENAILDAIAQSVLDNVEGCKKIKYRINGSAYSTANRTFALDYVYMDN